VEELNAVLPGYEVLELIGRGGMGAVYKASQLRLNRTVALKIFPHLGSSNPEIPERFRREAQAMATLNHPNIVTVYDYGETIDGRPFFAMELVTGTDLASLILAEPEPAQALSIVPQICEALQYAHDQGIVHRDIKPSNILLSTDGTVKVADFGLAKLMGPADVDFTHTNAAMGTPDYMSPEQRRQNQAVDHRADIYSLGIVFYELLTGELPKGVFDPPSRKVPSDVRLDEVVLRAMNEKPDRRYQQASQMSQRVEEIRDSSPGKERGRKLIRNFFAILLLMLLAIGAGWIVWDQQKRPSEWKSKEEVKVPALEQLRIDNGWLAGTKVIYFEANGYCELPPVRLKNLEAIRGLPIRELRFNGTQFSDPEILAPLKDMPLIHLLLENNEELEDYSFIVDLPRLEKLSLVGARHLSDIGFMADSAITSLRIDDTKVTDLSPLARSKLTLLDASNSGVRDLRPLRSLDLRFLDLLGTPVDDLSPLKGASLGELRISRSLDLSPLAGVEELVLGEEVTKLDGDELRRLGVRELGIGTSKVTDLTPLEGVSLNAIFLDPRRIRNGMEVLRKMTSLKSVSRYYTDGPPRWTRDEFFDERK